MSSSILKFNKYNEQSSDDSIITIKNIEQPNFYMIPNNKNPIEFLRKNLKTKYQILSKFHKDSEDKLIHS